VRTKLLLAATGIGVIAAGIAALRRAALREDLDWEQVEKPGVIVEVDGYGVHYVERGQGPAVVLLHGFGGSTFSHRHQIAALARDHRVIAIDLKGYGYSERRVGAGLSHTDQVRMVRGLLTLLGVERAAFLGHSMGGAIAQRLAAEHPEMVEALVLIASASAEERMPRSVRLPPALLRPLLPLIGRIAAERLLALGFHDHANLTEDVREGYMRPIRLRGSMDGLMGIMRDAANDGPVDLAAVRAPALILAGEGDRVVPLATAQRLRKRLPRASLRVVPESAHLLHEERPDECNEAILAFLREAREAAGAARSY
jgi:pimeloyl-ACP methyl ester carboxylesterase